MLSYLGGQLPPMGRLTCDNLGRIAGQSEFLKYDNVGLILWLSRLHAAIAPLFDTFNNGLYSVAPCCSGVLRKPRVFHSWLFGSTCVLLFFFNGVHSVAPCP